MAIRAALFFFFWFFFSFVFLYLACGTTPVCAHVVRVRRVSPARPTESGVKHASLAAGDKEEVEDIRKEPEIGEM